jgi:hypothetical protein
MNDFEIWKPARGFEGLYEVSNQGRVKSLIANRNGRRIITKSNKILKFGHDGCGYLRVRLTGKDGLLHQWLVHRLVLYSFSEKADLSKHVNHINGIKSDNRLENLEWCNQSENMKHAYRIGLEKPCDNGLKKHITAIKNGERKEFVSIREMCRCLNLDRRSVQRVILGRLKQCKGYKFEVS